MMRERGRWNDCVRHCGDETVEFISEHFAESGRRMLLVCGGGFDPRSRVVAEHLAKVCSENATCMILREEIPLADETLRKRADDNTVVLQTLFKKHGVEPVEMFSRDQAVVGGRTAVRILKSYLADDITDLVVDFSAMSIGMTFPIVRYLLNHAENNSGGHVLNLHLFAVDEPLTDGAITSIASDRVTPVFGFKGELGLDTHRDAAKLWLPQLGVGDNVRTVLRRVHNSVEPDAVCPIIPMAPSLPRLGDNLIWEYRDEFENAWEVDARDLVFTHDSHPLDLYRTILRIHRIRQQVFRDVGGSMTILSPFGRKMLAIGALLAAIDGNFPVIRSEAVGYRMEHEQIAESSGSSEQARMVHLWLHGEAYPQDTSKEADQ